MRAKLERTFLSLSLSLPHCSPIFLAVSVTDLQVHTKHDSNLFFAPCETSANVRNIQTTDKVLSSGKDGDAHKVGSLFLMSGRAAAA